MAAPLISLQTTVNVTLMCVNIMGLLNIFKFRELNNRLVTVEQRLNMIGDDSSKLGKIQRNQHSGE